MKPKKCDMFKKQAKFLGRIASKHGYKLDSSTIEPVLKLKDYIPQTVGDVRKLVGLLCY